MTLDVLVSVVAAMLIYNTYPLTAIMIVLLALLDDIPIMTIASDKVKLENKPVRWHMGRMLMLSGVLGALAVAATLGLFLLARDLYGVSEDHARTMMFFQLVVGGHAMIFVSRLRGPFWTRPYPSWPLLAAVLGTQAIAILIAGFGWLMPAIGWSDIGYVIAYTLAWMIVWDLVKLWFVRVADQGLPHYRPLMRLAGTDLRDRRFRLHADRG